MMTVNAAREIMARVLSLGVGPRLSSLIEERGRPSSDTGVCREIDRTIEDLAGHWHDGEFISAPKIVEASRITIAYAQTPRA